MTTTVLSIIVTLSALLAPQAQELRCASLNQEFTLKAGETISLDDSGLKIRFEDVTEDSRCPEDVKCVWAGNGKIVLAVSIKGRTPGKINLNTMLEPREAPVDRYNIKLIKLDPYPKQATTMKKSDYAATLLVSRK